MVLCFKKLQKVTLMLKNSDFMLQIKNWITYLWLRGKQGGKNKKKYKNLSKKWMKLWKDSTINYKTKENK